VTFTDSPQLKLFTHVLSIPRLAQQLELSVKQNKKKIHLYSVKTKPYLHDVVWLDVFVKDAALGKVRESHWHHAFSARSSIAVHRLLKSQLLKLVRKWKKKSGQQQRKKEIGTMHPNQLACRPKAMHTETTGGVGLDPCKACAVGCEYTVNPGSMRMCKCLLPLQLGKRCEEEERILTMSVVGGVSIWR